MVALTRTQADVASLSDAGVVATSLIVQTDATSLRDSGIDRGARLTGRSTVALTDAVVRTVGRGRSVSDTAGLGDGVSAAATAQQAVSDLLAAVDDLLVEVAYAISIDDVISGGDDFDFDTGDEWVLEIDDELLITDSEPHNYDVLIG